MKSARPEFDDASAAHDLADALHSAAIRLLRNLRKEDAAAGLTGPQLSVLSVLVFAGPQSMGDLAAAEQVRLPTMSRLVSDLAARGLVDRTMEPANRRKARIAPTAEGERLLETGREMRLARLIDALRCLPAGETTKLARAIDTIRKLNESL